MSGTLSPSRADCRRRLVTVTAGGAELCGCAACGGIWVDNESARTVLLSPQRVFVDLANQAGHAATRPVSRPDRPGCPVCAAVLERTLSIATAKKPRATTNPTPISL